MNKRVKSNRVDPLRHGPECVPVFSHARGIYVLSINDISDLMYGTDYENRPDWEQCCADLCEYCEKYSVSYYAAPKEDFFLCSAVELAIEEGNSWVIAEDMS